MLTSWKQHEINIIWIKRSCFDAHIRQFFKEYNRSRSLSVFLAPAALYYITKCQFFHVNNFAIWSLIRLISHFPDNPSALYLFQRKLQYLVYKLIPRKKHLNLQCKRQTDRQSNQPLRWSLNSPYDLINLLNALVD